MKIAAFVPDLLDQSRIAAVAPVEFVASPAQLPGAAADIVVVDLGRPGVLDVLPSLGASRVIGFARHTDTETLVAARATGAVEVLIRSAFFPHVAELLGGG